MTDFDTLWETNWGGEPVGSDVKFRFADRWVRFHSLPNSNRYADDEVEYAEIARRHSVIVDELRGTTGGSDLLLIAEDYDARDSFSGWVAKALPAAQLWREVPRDDSLDDPARSFWITPFFQSMDEIAAVLRNVADDAGGSIIVSDRTLGWLYHPYDGGGDAIAPTAAVRDELRARHPEWLSSRADGL